MTRVRVHDIAISLDGFIAGPDQSLEQPLGVGGDRLHTWVFETRFGRAMIGEPGGEAGVDNDFLERGVDAIGATVMGRNMFGPVRGPWADGSGPDGSWTGWWGPEPPYHHPVFVLTHHARPPLQMAGGTTFTFVDSLPAALAMAAEAADGKDVRIGGGAMAIRQCLSAGVVDELHLAIVPTLLGSGERLLDEPHLLDGLAVAELAHSRAVLHVVYSRGTSQR